MQGIKKKMKMLAIFLLIIPINVVLASADKEFVQQTIRSLGLDIENFNTIWPHYCKPHWRATYEGNLLETSDLVMSAHKSGFMNAQYEKGKTNLSPGAVCDALLAYYLDDQTSPELSDFIKRDKAIRDKYGFSSLDLYKTSANYFESHNTYNWPEKDVQFLERIMERHRKTNTFVIEKQNKDTTIARKDGEFVVDEDGEFQNMTVKPYAVYYLRPSEALISAHEKLDS